MKSEFSPMEAKIFAALKRRKNGWKTRELVEVVYKGKDAPVHAMQTVQGAVKRVKEKARLQRLPFRVNIVGTSGPHGMIYSLSER